MSKENTTKVHKNKKQGIDINNNTNEINCTFVLRNSKFIYMCACVCTCA